MTYIQPGICVLIALVLIGAAMRESGRRFRIVAALGLFLWAWPPFAVLFSGTLERQYPASPIPPGDAGAIVVLSSGIYSGDPSQPEVLPGFGTYLRCQHAAWLYRHWKPLPILVTGGTSGNKDDIPVADVMKTMLEREGIPASAIWVESRSTSTWENAQYSATLLRERGIQNIALVTEAHHMPRSAACFRKQGLTVAAAPCGFRSVHLNSKWTAFLPGPHAIEANEDVLHEWVGILWYHLKGRL